MASVFDGEDPAHELKAVVDRVPLGCREVGQALIEKTFEGAPALGENAAAGAVRRTIACRRSDLSSQRSTQPRRTSMSMDFEMVGNPTPRYRASSLIVQGLPPMRRNVDHCDISRAGPARRNSATSSRRHRQMRSRSGYGHEMWQRDEGGFLVLSHEDSSCLAEHLVAVSHPVPDAEMVYLSGDFLTKFFEGAFSHAREWATEMAREVEAQGRRLDECTSSTRPVRNAPSTAARTTSSA